MSEQERTRLARLLQAPRFAPASSEKIVSPRSVPPVTVSLKRHLAAHYRGWAAGAVAVACLAILVVAVKVEGVGNDSIQLQARDRSGQLQIRWDPNADPIRRAVGAKLYIVDGSARLYVKLDAGRLRKGAVSYERRSDRVELRLTLAQPDGKSVEEQATFVGRHPSSTEEWQWEAKAQPEGAAHPAPATAPAGETIQSHEIVGAAASSGHRTRKKPLEQSGTNLPFTCSAGDKFHKTDAPAGWDRFTCRGNNVWSTMPAQTRDGRPASTSNPNATTLTAKPATPSST